MHYRGSILLSILTMTVCIGSFDNAALTAEPASFYQGKVVRIVVGAAPGGGFDVYARAIARHWGKHIPGHPEMLVENQPGAATEIAEIIKKDEFKRQIDD